MASEQLKGLLFEWLNKPENRRSLNFDTCATGIAWLAKDRYPDLLHKGTKDGVVLLADTAKLNLVEIVWDLIIGRVLIPGDQSNAWPTLSITAHGEQVIRDQKPTPYDPDKYLERLSSDSPKLHPTVARYTQEALDTFRTGNHLASAVMIGAASERLFQNLFDSLRLTRKVKFAEQVNSVTGWCNRNRKSLPPPWNTDDHADDIDQIATFIRRSRNDAGHPKDPPAEPTQEQMYATLMVFPDYCKHICALIAWADAQATLPAA